MLGSMISLIFCTLTQAYAQEEKSAFERSLERDTSVVSEETTVTIKNKRYKKIEFNGGRYYVVLHEGKNVADIYCAPPQGAKDEHLVEAPLDPIRRNAAFVRAFHQACDKMKDSNLRTDLHLTPEMQFGLTETKGKKKP